MITLSEKKLAQNIQALIGEIGEKAVLLRLAIFAHNHSGWQVFKNVGEPGYDILLTNAEKGVMCRIEVKTRQRLQTTSKRPNKAMFDLTRGEYNACDFLIAYWLERGEYYIVPKRALKPVNGGRLWRFRVVLKKEGEPGRGAIEFRENWSQLHRDFA